MNRLEIEATDSTPYINCDGNGKIEFRGRSIPENATSFYSPVLEWLDEYSKSPGENTTIDCYLDYINSISQKIILEILYRLENIKKNTGHTVNVHWRFEEDDEEMREEGEIFASKVDLDFQLIREADLN